jgi:hypothetical protein
LIQNVNEIKESYDKLELGYDQLFKVLGIKFEAFEEWKEKRREDTNFSLIKLSDGSFISLQLASEGHLLYNNEIIPVVELEQKINRMIQQLTSFYTTMVTEETGYDSDSTVSSVASPFSPRISPMLTPQSETITTSFFDLNLQPMTLFRTNRLLLVILIEHFYSSPYHPSLFLKDFLQSFYHIIQTFSKSLTSSTYFTHVISHITSMPSHFNKLQLCEHLGIESFNSDEFLRAVVEVLGMNAVLNGEYEELRGFIGFVENHVCSNRKKLHMDKLKHLRFFHLTMDLVEKFQREDIKRKKISKNYEVLERLVQGLRGDHKNLEILKDFYKKFLTSYALILKTSPESWLFKWLQEVEIACGMLLSSTFPQFQQVLTHSLTTGSLHQPLRAILEKFCSSRSPDMVIQGLTCPQMDSIVQKAWQKEQPGVRMADIQLILESVDWKSESPDDVLKKIGVL